MAVVVVGVGAGADAGAGAGAGAPAGDGSVFISTALEDSVSRPGSMCDGGAFA